MKKYIFMFIFVIFIIFLTLFNVCSDNILVLIKDCIKNLNYMYIVILFLMVFAYFLLQGLYMKFILGSLNSKISMWKGIFYSMVEFYFSGITPSSTAGQPMQLYFMTKDKIPMSNSYITLILNTMFFKIIIILLGTWILLFKNAYIASFKMVYLVFFIIGLVFDVLLIVVCNLLLFHQSLIKKLFSFFIKMFKYIPGLKNKFENIDLEGILKKYKNQIKYIKSHKVEVVISFIMTFIQRIIMLSIPYVIYRGLGMMHLSYIEVLAIQISVQITVEAFPLPGGTGLSEHMLVDMFSGLVGIGIAEVGMIFTRLFIYYIPLVICCIFITFIYIKIQIKENKRA